MRAPAVVAGGAAVCVLLAVAVLLGSRGPGPLDQPDRAEQRNGLVLDGPTVEPSVAGVALQSLPNVLLFVRSRPDADALSAWRRSLPAAAQVTVVVQQPDASAGGPGARKPVMVDVVMDAEQRLAAS